MFLTLLSLNNSEKMHMNYFPKSTAFSGDTDFVSLYRGKFRILCQVPFSVELGIWVGNKSLQSVYTTITAMVQAEL